MDVVYCEGGFDQCRDQLLERRHAVVDVEPEEVVVVLYDGVGGGVEAYE